jgi:hypothetical protein
LEFWIFGVRDFVALLFDSAEELFMRLRKHLVSPSKMKEFVKEQWIHVYSSKMIEHQRA